MYTVKKDIYIITNDINSKVYIGQTVNPKQRWSQYKCQVRRNPNAQVITRAMDKYGIEHFTMSVLEEKVINYDEREQYWIQKYNSLVPNGYNVAIGGSSSGVGINSPVAKIKDEDTLYELIDEVIQNEIPLTKLSKKYGISFAQLESLNKGLSYRVEGLNYPLRPIKRHSKEKIDQLIYALQYELDKSMADLSKEYGIEKSCVNDINQGRMWHKDYLTYPLRLGKMKKAELIHPQIQQQLMETKIPQKEIAKAFGVSQNIVSEINQGKRAFNKDLTYPLRINNPLFHTTLSPDIVKEIFNLLENSNKSLKEIGEIYEVSASVIAGINSGRTKKYRDESKSYPIRKK